MYSHIKRIIITSSTLIFNNEEMTNKFKVGNIFTIDGATTFDNLIKPIKGVFLDTVDGSVKVDDIWIFNEKDSDKPDSLGIVCFRWLD